MVLKLSNIKKIYLKTFDVIIKRGLEQKDANLKMILQMTFCMKWLQELNIRPQDQ